MIDYSHIPLHLRITERWKIDPAYDEARYYRDRRRTYTVTTHLREWPRVPESVLDYAASIGGMKSGVRAWWEIAGAVRMLPGDFCEMVKAHRKKLERTPVSTYNVRDLGIPS